MNTGHDRDRNAQLEYVRLTGRNHPLARQASLRLDALHGIECIGLVEASTSRNQLSSALQRAGVALVTTMTVCDWDTAINLVELGLGSTIVPSWYAHSATNSAAVVAIPISDLPPIRVGWAMRESYEPIKPAKEFMRLLKQDLKTRQPQAGVRLLR